MSSSATPDQVDAFMARVRSDVENGLVSLEKMMRAHSPCMVAFGDRTMLDGEMRPWRFCFMVGERQAVLFERLIETIKSEAPDGSFLMTAQGKRPIR